MKARSDDGATAEVNEYVASLLEAEFRTLKSAYSDRPLHAQILPHKSIGATCSPRSMGLQAEDAESQGSATCYQTEQEALCVSGCGGCLSPCGLNGEPFLHS